MGKYSFEFILPTKIRYGAGMIKALGEELRDLKARKIMVITDKDLVNAGMLDKVTKIINEESVDYVIYDEIEANPKDYNVEAFSEVARLESIDTIVAFGGGSPIDAAKVVAVLSRQGGKFRDYQGKGRIKEIVYQ